MNLKKRVFLYLTLLLIILGISVFVIHFFVSAKKPNIIIILSDTLRKDHLGCYGYKRKTSPNIDRFAQNATVYKNAFAQSPSTKPSVTSIFTSMYPNQHNVIHNKNVLNSSHLTLAEILLQNGYQTCGFIENPMIASQFKFNQGFLTWKMDDRRHKRSNESMETFDKKILSWLKKNHKGSFFLYIHFIDPHSPYIAPSSFYNFFDPEYAGKISGNETDPKFKRYYRNNRRDLEHLISLYDDEIRYIDSRFEKIIKQLKKLKILNESIIIFTSDHGEEFLEHGNLLHSSSVYSELINIPLIIRYPRLFKKGYEKKYVQHIDIFPTITNILGIKTNQLHLEGMDVRSGIQKKKGAISSPAKIISEHLRVGWGKAQRCIIYKNWKLIHNLGTNDYNLYNIVKDPMEAKDLISGYPEIASKFKSLISTYLQDQKSKITPEETELDEETEKKLKSLGYISSESPSGKDPIKNAVKRITVTRSRNNPLITFFSSKSLEDNINGPSVIRVPSWIKSPMGKYYMYFAHHNGSYIRLAYADSLHGPWIIYEPGILKLSETKIFWKHIASPDVHVDDIKKEIRMYFHGPLKGKNEQMTGVALSTDGIKFKSTNKILGKFYFRVFKWKNFYYAIAKNWNTGYGELLRSRDGLVPFQKHSNFISRMRHAALLLKDDLLLIFYSRVGDAPERILMSTMQLSNNWTLWKESQPIEVIRPEKKYEGIDYEVKPSRIGSATEVCQLRDPSIFTEDGKIYLFYTVAGEMGISMAELFIEY